jgi:putative heme transporter
VGRGWVRAVAAVVSVALAVWLLAVGLPAVAGVRWVEITDALGSLPALTLLWLLLLWLASLWAYSYVLTGSLPGLTRTQALVLNTAGSAVSNVVPFGGAAGTLVTVAMAASWGYSRRAIAVSTLVSGIWNVLSRMALPAVGLLALLASGHLPDRRITLAAAIATGVLVCAVTVVIAVLARDAWGRWIGWAVERFVNVLPPRMRPAPGIAERLSRLRRTAVAVTGRAWAGLTLGMLGFLGLQCALFSACAAATSANLSAGAAIAAFATSRLLATAPLTPGGVGVSEAGTAALLVALGAAPAPAAAALLLFGLFSYALEIPVGMLAWVTWVLTKRWRSAPPAGYLGEGSDPLT